MTFDSMIQNLNILQHKRFKLGQLSKFYHLFPTAHMPSNDSIWAIWNEKDITWREDFSTLIKLFKNYIIMRF